MITANLIKNHNNICGHLLNATNLANQTTIQTIIHPIEIVSSSSSYDQAPFQYSIKR